MKQTDERYQQYIKVLKEELVAAMGCTEPVSIAYAAAVPASCWALSQGMC